MFLAWYFWATLVLCAQYSTHPTASLSRLLLFFFSVRTTRGWGERWRRSSERGRSWRGSSGEFWRTWTTRPGTRPTSEISVCLIVVKETKQTCEVLFNLSEQKLPTFHSSYPDSEWTFMRNQMLDRTKVPSQLTVMLWGQSATRHDEITSCHCLRSLFYFDIVHSTQHSKVFLTNSAVAGKKKGKHIFKSRT